MQRNSDPEGISTATIEIENFPCPRFRETYIPHQVYIWKPLRRCTVAHRSAISYLRLSSRSDSWTREKKCDRPYSLSRLRLAEITILRTFSFLVPHSRHLNLIRLSDFTISTVFRGGREPRFGLRRMSSLSSWKPAIHRR